MLQITVTTDEESGHCPIRNVLVGISGKWQSLIILSLEDGPLRFSQIKRTIGDISPRVLTQNLRTLERDGHITRTVNHGPPIAVSYQLTPLGHEFLEIWKPVALWAENKFEAVTAARKKYETKSK